MALCRSARRADILRFADLFLTKTEKTNRCPTPRITSTRKNTSGSRSTVRRAQSVSPITLSTPLGDIVFVELPKVGDALESGTTFGSIESVKSVSDLFAPVSGTVTEINETLTSAPETINADANNTWIVKFSLTDPSQLDALLDAAAYEAFTSEETGH